MGINTQIPRVLDHVINVCEPDITVIINELIMRKISGNELFFFLIPPE